MDQKIRFGPAGNSDAFYEQGHKHTAEAPAWIAGLGLSAFEYSFGRGVKMKEETGEKIKQQAQQYQIAMSVHAPYYINLANNEFEKNLTYFVESATAGQYLGAGRIVFHPGSVGVLSREQAFLQVKQSLQKIILELKGHGFSQLLYCPETMGKQNQVGSLEEVIELCAVDEAVYPAIDFGHLNARTGGGIKTKADYARILDALKNGVGEEKCRNMHIHFSHIQYTDKGEKVHLTFADQTWGPFFEPLAQLLAERALTPVVICESKGTQAKDACAMKRMYEDAL